MRFWDSSAIIPLLVGQPATRRSTAAMDEDPAMVVWWGTPVECVGALARLDREAAISTGAYTLALERLAVLEAHWTEIAPTPRVRTIASRILRTSQLRAADALQLAAAVVASEDAPATLQIVTYDERLGAAAVREGFGVVGPVDG